MNKDDIKRRKLFTTWRIVAGAIMIAGFLLSYLAALGPVVYCDNKRSLRTYLPPQWDRTVETVFGPAFWLVPRCRYYQDYVYWWGYQAKGWRTGPAKQTSSSHPALGGPGHLPEAERAATPRR